MEIDDHSFHRVPRLTSGVIGWRSTSRRGPSSVQDIGIRDKVIATRHLPDAAESYVLPAVKTQVDDRRLLNGPLLMLSGRLYSGAGVTITERRDRLGVESIEALECLKSWSKGGYALG
jgi:hypothetical protein